MQWPLSFYKSFSACYHQYKWHQTSGWVILVNNHFRANLIHLHLFSLARDSPSNCKIQVLWHSKGSFQTRNWQWRCGCIKKTANALAKLMAQKWFLQTLIWFANYHLPLSSQLEMISCHCNPFAIYSTFLFLWFELEQQIF